MDGIVETCINVAEINRAREFYQSLFNEAAEWKASPSIPTNLLKILPDANDYPKVGLEEAGRRVIPIESGVPPSLARHNAEANCLGVRPKMRSPWAT